jgi:hypothetical protein
MDGTEPHISSCVVWGAVVMALVFPEGVTWVTI